MQARIISVSLIFHMHNKDGSKSVILWKYPAGMYSDIQTYLTSLRYDEFSFAVTFFRIV